MIRFESMATVPLTLYFHDIQLSKATGFLYRFGTEVVLATNWHVFSGLHPETGAHLNSSGFTPNRVEFTYFVKSEANDNSAICCEAKLTLAENGQATWFEHEGYSLSPLKIPDVAMLPLNDALTNFEEIGSRIVTFTSEMLIQVADKQEDWRAEHAYPMVASDVFILGFPKGIRLQGTVPIWKRGSVATEPLLYALDNAPVFLVDAVTRSGMSGSPVIFLGDKVTNRSGEVTSIRNGKQSAWLMGVYAGREGVSDAEIDMALGRVWRRETLDGIFFKRVVGASRISALVATSYQTGS